MECKLDRVLEIGNSGILIGEVVMFHVDDSVATPEGTVDPAKLKPLGRLGGSNYAPLREVAEVTAESFLTQSSDLIDLWDELRQRTIAMAGALSVEHLGRRLSDGMTVGRMLRHMAACTAYRVLTWEGREDEDTVREWDESWTAERLVAELEEDRQAFLAALPLHPHRHELQRMIRHEGWHQGQIALLLRRDFEEIWRL